MHLPRRGESASKRIAYVEFKDEENVERALSKHHKLIKGRIVWKLCSKPPKKQENMRAQAIECVLKSLEHNVVGSLSWAKTCMFSASLLLELGEKDGGIEAME